jgi:hypothetical protein
MKKQLLFVVSAAIALQANAQNKRVLNTPRVADTQVSRLLVEPATQNTASTAAHKNGSIGVNTTPLSFGPNAFGMAANARPVIWADPSINAISFIHRNHAATSGFGISGDLNSDFSTDGGATWTLNGQVYYGAATAGPLFPARYPSGAIYNPPGNTTASNAFAVAVGPTLDATNDAWGGFANGSGQLTAGATATSSQVSSDGAAGFYQYIPEGFQIIKNTGNAVALDQSIDIATDYTDNMIWHSGTWNAGAYTYTRSLIPIPVSTSAAGSKAMATYSLAMSDDGMVGYIVAIGHNDFTLFPDEAYYPIVYKTSDGGATWVGPWNLDMAPLEAVIPAYDGTTGNLVSTSFEVDAVMDNANNLHIVTSACAGAGNFSIYQGDSVSAVVDIYTTDGGATWKAQELGLPKTARGTYGDNSAANANLTHDNRTQASRTWDGTKLMFTWFDTDDASFPGLGNTYPDAYSVGYNVTTGLWTAGANKTPGLSTLMFAQCSYYAMDAAGTQTVPVAFQVISGTTATGEPLNTGGVVDYVYSGDVTFTDADYTVVGNPINIPIAAGVNEQPIVASSVSVVPNPASGNTRLTYLLNNASDVTIKVVNMIGATVVEMVKPTQTAGQHEVALNVSELKAGVYFVNVTAKGSVSTTKLIVK